MIELLLNSRSILIEFSFNSHRILIEFSLHSHCILIQFSRLVRTKEVRGRNTSVDGPRAHSRRWLHQQGGYLVSWHYDLGNGEWRASTLQPTPLKGNGRYIVMKNRPCFSFIRALRPPSTTKLIGVMNLMTFWKRH